MKRKQVKFVGLVLLLFVAALGLVACVSAREEGRDPITIGLITNSTNGLRNIQGFRDGMAELDYPESDAVSYLFQGKPVDGEMLDSALQAMLDEGVDLIFTAGTPTGIAAHRVTAGTDTPGVFGVIADPINAGVVADLTRPGRNMTGVMLAENQGKRLELLLEIAPDIRRIFVPYDPTDAASVAAMIQLRKVALALNLELVEGTASSDVEAVALLDNYPDAIDAIFLVPGTIVNARLQLINAIALRDSLPVSAPSTLQVEQGALMTYGFVHYEAGKQAAHIAAQVLNGTPAGEIPIEIAETYLVINLDTAAAIGLEVPYPILQQTQFLIYSDE